MLRFTHVGVFSLHTNFLFLLLFIPPRPFYSKINVKGGISFFYLHSKPGTRSSVVLCMRGIFNSDDTFELRRTKEILNWNPNCFDFFFVNIKSVVSWNWVFEAGLTKCSVITLDVHKLFCTINHREEKKSAWLWKICAAFGQLLFTATGRLRASL